MRYQTVSSLKTNSCCGDVIHVCLGIQPSEENFGYRLLRQILKWGQYDLNPQPSAWKDDTLTRTCQGTFVFKPLPIQPIENSFMLKYCSTINTQLQLIPGGGEGIAINMFGHVVFRLICSILLMNTLNLIVFNQQFNVQPYKKISIKFLLSITLTIRPSGWW